jgi:hypothetical protein
LAQPEYKLSLNVVHHNSPPNSHLVEKTSRHTIYLTRPTSHRTTPRNAQKTHL